MERDDLSLCRASMLCSSSRSGHVRGLSLATQSWALAVLPSSTPYTTLIFRLQCLHLRVLKFRWAFGYHVSNPKFQSRHTLNLAAHRALTLNHALNVLAISNSNEGLRRQSCAASQVSIWGPPYVPKKRWCIYALSASLRDTLVMSEVLELSVSM